MPHVVLAAKTSGQEKAGCWARQPLETLSDVELEGLLIDVESRAARVVARRPGTHREWEGSGFLQLSDSESLDESLRLGTSLRSKIRLLVFDRSAGKASVNEIRGCISAGSGDRPSTDDSGREERSRCSDVRALATRTPETLVPVSEQRHGPGKNCFFDSATDDLAKARLEHGCHGRLRKLEAGKVDEKAWTGILIGPKPAPSGQSHSHTRRASPSSSPSATRAWPKTASSPMRTSTMTSWILKSSRPTRSTDGSSSMSTSSAVPSSRNRAPRSAGGRRRTVRACCAALTVRGLLTILSRGP